MHNRFQDKQTKKKLLWKAELMNREEFKELIGWFHYI